MQMFTVRIEILLVSIKSNQSVMMSYRFFIILEYFNSSNWSQKCHLLSPKNCHNQLSAWKRTKLTNTCRCKFYASTYFPWHHFPSSVELPLLGESVDLGRIWVLKISHRNREMCASVTKEFIWNQSTCKENRQTFSSRTIRCQLFVSFIHSNDDGGDLWYQEKRGEVYFDLKTLCFSK